MQETHNIGEVKLSTLGRVPLVKRYSLFEHLTPGTQYQVQSRSSHPLAQLAKHMATGKLPSSYHAYHQSI